MCGIFALMFHQNDLEHGNIYNSFQKGKCRGPEFSHLEIVNGESNKSNNMNVYFGFHRLAINGLNDESNQPFHYNNVTLICNGEIYNYKELYALMNIKPNTDSDCEVILHVYRRYGIEHTLKMLDGVFAFVLYDHQDNTIYCGRDPYGVRPLYFMKYQQSVFKKNIYAFSSELKMLIDIYKPSSTTITLNKEVQQVKPGTFSVLKMNSNSQWYVSQWAKQYNMMPFGNILPFDRNLWDSLEDGFVFSQLRYHLQNAIEKRILTTERPIACLLSGGLDSSLICALVAKYAREINNTTIETYSIGLAGSDDLHYARLAASFLKTKHHEVIVTEEEFLAAIPEVIYKIESYDTTTIRASVGNYLVSKYISENSDAKVIFNGDGADELMGGYLYFHKTSDPIEFDRECRRLLEDIYMYDVLRSDRTISSCGLEPRTPFLDRTFVQYYLTLNPVLRCHSVNQVCEKYLIRKAFGEMNILPKEILWRTKEAFSDGVSKQTRSWYQIIQEHVENILELPKQTDSFGNNFILYKEIPIYLTGTNYKHHNKPETKEQMFYRSIFEHYYPNCEKLIPYFWMPKYVDAKDSSARTLDIYPYSKYTKERMILEK